MAVKYLIVDDPEATIEYMLRKKVIKFPVSYTLFCFKIAFSWYLHICHRAA